MRRSAVRFGLQAFHLLKSMHLESRLIALVAFDVLVEEVAARDLATGVRTRYSTK